MHINVRLLGHLHLGRIHIYELLIRQVREHSDAESERQVATVHSLSVPEAIPEDLKPALVLLLIRAVVFVVLGHEFREGESVQLLLVTAANGLVYNMLHLSHLGYKDDGQRSQEKEADGPAE